MEKVFNKGLDYETAEKNAHKSLIFQVKEIIEYNDKVFLSHKTIEVCGMIGFVFGSVEDGEPNEYPLELVFNQNKYYFECSDSHYDIDEDVYITNDSNDRDYIVIGWKEV